LRSLATASLAASLTLDAHLARAQEYLPAGSVHLASGIEGSGRGFSRARTRLRVAAELRTDESPDNAIVVAAIVDLEPRAAFGAEVRYMRSMSERIFVGGGAISYIAPAILIGPCAGAELRWRLFTKSYLAVGPEITAFPIGTDLPDGTVIWQTLLQVGFRADL